MIATHRTNGTHAAPAPGAVAEHVRLHLASAVYRVLHAVRRYGPEAFDDVLERHPHLDALLGAMLAEMPEGVSWDDGLDWWQGRIDAVEAAADARLPLAALRTEAGLSAASVGAFVVAGLVEEDVRFGTLFADLQAPLPHRRPCLDLLGRLGAGEGTSPWAVVRPLVEAGLLVPEDASAPRAEWALRIPSVLWDAARGEAVHVPGLSIWAAGDLPERDDLVLPEAFLARVGRVPSLLREGPVRAVTVRGPFGSGRGALLGTVARSLGRGIVEADAGALDDAPPLGPLCTLLGAMPAVRYDLGPGETVAAPASGGYAGPWGFVLGKEGAVRGGAAEAAVTLTVPTLRAADRRRAWAAVLDGHDADLDALARRFHLPGDTIRRAASGAVATAALDGRGAVSPEDARASLRALGRQHLDALAERLEADGRWEHLVVPPACDRQLHELEERCRHRERLLDHLGAAFGTSMNRGVRALFAGPSGTGKTLAARVLAAELGMDLYRIDLASVVNKYIGETEKNLHRVLAAAEALDVVLLLDEGDALMGARTDVKSANDRYANLETNYLLQRLEHYDGVVIVTTNLGENVDRAFQRRMDAVVDFQPPEAEERRAIWDLHLDADLPEAVLSDVAARCVLTGGQIRNAALRATLAALADGTEAVAPRHVEYAVRREYQKAGATCPLPPVSGADASDGVRAFLDAL